MIDISEAFQVSVYRLPEIMTPFELRVRVVRKMMALGFSYSRQKAHKAMVNDFIRQCYEKWNN